MVDEYIKRGEEEFQQQVREARSRDPEPAADFQSARVAKLDGLSDLEVLRKYANENRVLVSHNFKTMP